MQNKKQTSKQNKTNKQNYKNSPRQTELYINTKKKRQAPNFGSL